MLELHELQYGILDQFRDDELKPENQEKDTPNNIDNFEINLTEIRIQIHNLVS